MADVDWLPKASRQAGEHDEEECDEGDDASHEGEAALGEADVAQGEKHGIPLVRSAIFWSRFNFPVMGPVDIGKRMDSADRLG